METTPFSYAGEGSDTLRLKNQYFDGVLFIHQNETCPGACSCFGVQALRR